MSPSVRLLVWYRSTI